jgi:hypothetical protein
MLAESGPAGRTPEFLSSHPDPGNRQALIQRAIESRFPGGVPEQLTLGRRLQVAR